MFQSLSLLSQLLIAGVLMSVFSMSILPSVFTPEADITLQTATRKTPVAEPFVVDVQLEATQPVNAFKGIVTFDTERLTIERIDYNTSVADLWAEEPWYSNGDGTLTFIGGTTRSGGFTGEESIVKITFTSKKVGDTAIGMRDIEILHHDGLGTNATVPKPIDSIFTVTPALRSEETVAHKDISDTTKVYILETNNSTDLNNDGRHTIADTSIFMTHLATQNLRSDFNQDGVVNLTDLSILNQ